MKVISKYRLLAGAMAMLMVSQGCDILGVLKKSADTVSTTVKKTTGLSTSHDLSTVSFDKNTYPCVVMGGGIGGLTASVYLSMANVHTMVAQGEMPGGLLTQSLSVRNWPGEIETPGAAITDKLQAQATKRGVSVEPEKVTGVDLSVWPYQIRLAHVNDPTKTRTVKALTTVIGMGASSNYLGVPGEKEYWSKGVTNCAVCEGSLYRDKTVCVVGGGDSAMEETSYLAGLAKKVYIFVRRDKLRAVDNRKDEVIAMSNVEVVYNTSLKEIIGDSKKVTKVKAINNVSKEEKEYTMDGVFLAIGFTPNTQMFKDQLELTSGGYIALKHDQLTSLPGVYAVGDIVDPRYKQAVTAAGDGCRAALQAHEYLGHIGFKPQMAQPEREVVGNQPAAKSAGPVEKPAHAKDEPKATKDEGDAIPVAPEQEAGKYAPGVVHEIKSAEQYQELIKTARKPVIVDFFATWCGPCKLIAPLYKKLAKEYADKVHFIKVNIDVVGSIGSANSIHGVPTFTFIKAGQEQSRLVGGHYTAKQFKAKIDELL